jgi:tRNA 2-selenouridine synthase
LQAAASQREGGIRETDDASPAALARFDAVIDVRSPGEFAIDHVPGAINLPVLDDLQRAEVGTIYVRGSKFVARRTGAAHAARNIAAHLEGGLGDRPGSFRPLVYCWRGGQRSHAMATVMDQVGWPVTLLRGGYRTWRRRVTAALYDEGAPLRLTLLDGDTGTGKTDVLARLAARGVQTLDLEALAQHRGSLFGALPGRPQPSQKLFESRLFAALERLDAAQPIVVEAESSKVGRLFVPPRLWRAMSEAPRIALRAPAAARARYLVEAYADIAADAEALARAIARLPVHHSRERRAAWLALARAGEVEALAAALIEAHYDPAYARAETGPRLGTIDLPALTEPDREAAAAAVFSLLASEADRPT